ncbi:MAG: BLUF domain-containing protein [Bryobacteraceae bacterium]
MSLYKLVYCSRNRIPGSGPEVSEQLQGILASSRANNERAGITGALLYSAGNFAQVLEGPLASIEKTFEVIQRDPRHSEVVVIQSGPAETREFPEWSMAFAGNNDTEKMPHATAAFEAVFANSVGSGEQMISVLRDLIVREDAWALLDAA